MAITLYDLAGAETDRRFSPFCWRTRMALAHKGLAFEARYDPDLVVRLDPRVKTSTADLQQQFDKSMQAYEDAMSASRALGQVRDLEKQIASRKSSDKLAAYEKQLETLSEQSRELATLAQKIATETAEPIREGINKAFRQAA